MFGYDQTMFKKDRILPVLKVSRGGEAQLSITCEGCVQVVQHYITRSFLCPGADCCPACETSVQYRGVCYTVGIVNQLHYLVTLPGSFPEAQCNPGQQLFLARSRRNNQMKYQLGLFRADQDPDCTINELWKFVLRIYKVRFDGDFDHLNSDHVRSVKAAAMSQIEAAVVQQVSKR